MSLLWLRTFHKLTHLTTTHTSMKKTFYSYFTDAETENQETESIEPGICTQMPLTSKSVSLTIMLCAASKLPLSDIQYKVEK